MGFWKKLFGLEKKTKAKLDVFAIDADGDGKVQDGTVWERPAAMSVDLDKTLEKVEELLKEVAPDAAVSEKLVKKAKTQQTAKKAAATRAANKAKAEPKKASSAKKPASTKKPAAKTKKK